MQAMYLLQVEQKDYADNIDFFLLLQFYFLQVEFYFCQRKICKCLKYFLPNIFQGISLPGQQYLFLLVVTFPFTTYFQIKYLFFHF